MRAKTDLRKGDIVLVAEVNILRGQRPLGRVIDVNVGRDGVCVAACSECVSQIVRPVTKMCLLETSN